MTARRTRRAATAAALAVLVLVVGCTVPRPAHGPPQGVAAILRDDRGGYAGTLLDPPPPRPALRLMGTSGRPFDLRTRPATEATIVFFGYTNCEDVCPTTMADLSAARRALPAETRRHVVLVFVTEDPARDLPVVLRRWLDTFDPAIVGLIGGNRTTQRVLRQLHLPRTIRRDASPAPERSGVPGDTRLENGRHDGRAVQHRLDHSGAVYAFGPHGRTVLYTGGTTPREYSADFARLLRH